MLPDPIIEFSKVGKQYHVGHGGFLSALLRRIFNRQGAHRKFWALRDISFKVSRGEVLGIIGPNGAGKSTILKLLAGVTMPDLGEIRIHGRIAPLIELGAGFHPELTGRENVYLNGALLGLSRVEIDERYEDIVEFAELREFMETPVKHYSSGMFVRLGFSLAVHTDPDILLIDEVLSVGDEHFQRKCIRKFLEFRAAGKTIVVVSHDLGLVGGICTSMIFLARGELVVSGGVDSAIGRYLQTLGEGDGVSVLRNRNKTILFNSGRIAIFEGGLELTKKVGAYTSILAGAPGAETATIWQDSTKAVWRCETRDRGEVVCVGEFISAPISQEWILKLDEDGNLYWSVWLDVKEPILVERRQANLMLSDSYDYWQAEDGSGKFPAEFTTRDFHNWEVLATPKGSWLAAKVGGTRADVRFESEDPGFLAMAVNSSFFFSGRVLMFLNSQPEVLHPGRYFYFRGCISTQIVATSRERIQS